MTDKIVGWVQTYSCRKFAPLDPKPESISIFDIAHALSNLCRFTGHTRKFYSVAQHCIHVSSAVPAEDRLWGLLHDASEAYLQDIASPIKKLPEFAYYRVIEEKLQSAICTKFGLEPVMPESVQEADLRMLYTEARDLMSPAHPDWTWSAKPYTHFGITPMTPEEAKERFLENFFRLAGKS